MKIAFLFLFLSINLSAQLDWTVEDIAFSSGDTVRAEFRVFDFDDAHVFTYVFKAKLGSSLSSELWLATCCLNPPMNPMAYKFPLKYMPLTVSYVSPSLDVDSPNELNVRIYPNPNYGAVTVESIEPVRVEIFNTSGRMTHQGQGARMDFFNLGAGINIVRITDAEGKTLTKTIARQ